MFPGGVAAATDGATRPGDMALSPDAAIVMNVAYPLATTAVVKTDIAYAGFLRRALAYLIDQVFLFGVGMALYWGASVVVPTSLQAIQSGSLQALGEVGPVLSAIAWAYYGIFESSPARATLGKIALGLYVADSNGDPITFRRAIYRNALKVVSWSTLGAGFLLAGFTPRKQTLHDLLAGTIVLRKVMYFEVGPQPPTEPGDHWDGTRWVASVPPAGDA